MGFIKVVFVLTALTLGFTNGWMNAMDKPLSYTCPDGKAMVEINSKHDNFFEDRVFDFSCRKLGKSPTGCQWSDYVNNFDQPFDFQCPNQSFLFGVDSYHDNTAEDRKWKFYCCGLSGVQLEGCYKTPHTKYDGPFSVLAPYNYVIRGVSTTSDNYYEDREYTFEMCRMRG